MHREDAKSELKNRAEKSLRKKRRAGQGPRFPTDAGWRPGRRAGSLLAPRTVLRNRGDRNWKIDELSANSRIRREVAPGTAPADDNL
jgi:hypothetical protein